MSAWRSVGTIADLVRYPVKSMGGERVDAAVVTSAGLAGDRVWALLEEDTGFIASAKHARKWGALLGFHAHLLEPAGAERPTPHVAIELPDGSRLRSDDPDVHRRLSRALGRGVRLVCQAPSSPTREADRRPPGGETEDIRREPMGLGAPPGRFVDYAPIHLVTTGTLAALGALRPGRDADPRRFRANVLLHRDGAADGEEHGWLGGVLDVEGTALELFDPCPRCVVTTLPRPARDGAPPLEADPGLLRALAARPPVAGVTQEPGAALAAVVGVYARCRGDGVLRTGAGARWTASAPARTR